MRGELFRVRLALLLLLLLAFRELALSLRRLALRVSRLGLGRLLGLATEAPGVVLLLAEHCPVQSSDRVGDLSVAGCAERARVREEGRVELESGEVDRLVATTEHARHVLLEMRDAGAPCAAEAPRADSESDGEAGRQPRPPVSEWTPGKDEAARTARSERCSSRPTAVC